MAIRGSRRLRRPHHLRRYRIHLFASVAVITILSAIAIALVTINPQSRARELLAQAAAAQDSMGLDSQCPTGAKYDYSCSEGQKSKDPKKICSEGKKVADSQVKGHCEGPDEAKADEYQDMDGDWMPVSKPGAQEVAGNRNDNQLAQERTGPENKSWLDQFNDSVVTPILGSLSNMSFSSTPPDNSRGTGGDLTAGGDAASEIESIANGQEELLPVPQSAPNNDDRSPVWQAPDQGPPAMLSPEDADKTSPVSEVSDEKYQHAASTFNQTSAQPVQPAQSLGQRLFNAIYPGLGDALQKGTHAVNQAINTFLGFR